MDHKGVKLSLKGEQLLQSDCDFHILCDFHISVTYHTFFFQ